MAAARRGVLALALSSSLPLDGIRASSAFHHNFRLFRGGPSSSFPSSRHVVFCNKSSSAAASVGGDDPSLKNDDVEEYERLKRSRPVRIRARLVSSDGGRAPTGEYEYDDDVESTRKIVHFQRHGQGTHNEMYREWTERTGAPLDLSETDPLKNPFVTDVVLDAPLTRKGRDQCEAQREAARELDGIEAVVVSPLVRALQTAHITFEDRLPHNTPDEVKWIVHEGIREELGTLLCNKRRPLVETRSEFPHVDYTHLPHDGDEDIVWNRHAERTRGDDGMPRRESTEDMSHRAYDFLVDFVRDRPEGEIAVVGHSAWLLSMTGAVLDIEEGDRGSITPMFGQAELRSMELIFSER